jgi:anti-anti-sigma regulatory factor
MVDQVKIAEEFFIGNISEVMNEMLHALQGNQDVVIDLSDVKCVDSAAIQLLFAARKEAEHMGVNLNFTLSDTVSSYALSIGVSL